MTGEKWESPCGRVVLYCGDCLEVLPTVQGVDAIVTDPPYSSGGAFRSDRTAPTSVKYLGSHGNAPKVDIEFGGDSRDGRSFLFWCTMWMLRCYDASTPSAISRPMSGRFSHQAEFILWGSKGALGWDFEKPCLNGVQRFQAPKEHHQTEKPVELLASMIEIVGETVLDPFMGSGTTGVAAVRLGRRFIGVEKEPAYFEIAKRRIMDALGMEVSVNGVTQRRMFT